METRYVGVEICVHLNAVGVEFQLGGVQQGFGGGKAGDNDVHSLDKVNDVGHCAVGHCGGDVTGNGVGQGGADV